MYLIMVNTKAYITLVFPYAFDSIPMPFFDTLFLSDVALFAENLQDPFLKRESKKSDESSSADK